jgi:hypothetical protein
MFQLDQRMEGTQFLSPEPLKCLLPARLFIDKLRTGFLVWRKSLTSYHAPAAGDFRDTWEDASKDVIAAIRSQLSAGQWFQQVATLWSQESNRAHSSADLRTEHFMLIKMLCTLLSSLCMRSADKVNAISS